MADCVLSSAPAGREGEQPSVLPFLASLFGRLERSGIRYCVLHSHDTLPCTLASDLDMAVHPADFSKLIDVCRELAYEGYIPVQCLNYAVGANYIVFAWFDGFELRTAALDVITEHRRRGLVLACGEELIRDRRDGGGFRAASTQTEFSYLVTKKVLKGSIKPEQEPRLRALAEALGRERAEELACRLFGRPAAREVVDSCLAGSAREIVRRFRTRLWLTVFLNNPLKAISSWLSEAPRVWRRWWRPTGLLVAVLGADGVGKSTLLSGLGTWVRPCFRRRRYEHWHPTLLRRGSRIPNTDPHGQAVRGPALSVICLLLHFVDCWAAYLQQIRPVLARSGLVLFDRYFHDVLVDPKRYRYGGPMALAKAVCALCPKPDLVLVLDAPEAVMCARKREVAEEETARQRQEYIALASRLPNAFVIDGSRPKTEAAAAAASVAIQHLALRLCATRPEFRHAALPKPAGGGQPARTASRGTIVRAVTQLAGGECALRSIQQGGTTTITVVPSQTPTAPSASAAAGGASTLVRQHSFAIVPSKSHPRMLLPLGDRRTSLAGIEVYSPYARQARLLTSLLRQTARAGSDAWARHRVTLLSSGPLALETVVAEVTGEPRPVFSVFLGRPTRYAKATAQVMRPDGEILGYIKLPLTSKASLRLRREAAMLRELERFPAVRPHLPAVRCTKEWHDGYLLFQSPLRGRPAPARFTPLNQAFLDLLQTISPAQRGGQTLVDEVATRWEQIETLMDPEWRRLGQTALEFADRELSGGTVACGLVHGDFAPWNTRIAGGQLSVFDWESAAWSRPGVWDRFHFDVQTASLLHTREAKSSPESRALFVLYLIHSTSELIDEGTDLNAPGVRYRKEALRRLLGPGTRAKHSPGT